MGSCNFRSGDASVFSKLLEKLAEQGYIYLLVSHELLNLLVLLGRSTGSSKMVSKVDKYFAIWLELGNTIPMGIHDQFDI